jgi:predicted GNAT superfamily acetyltransferase
VAVREDQRGQGLARSLYESFRRLARGRGGAQIKAIARTENAASIAFHRSMGMDAIEVPGYSGPERARIVFSARLTSPPGQS